MLQRLSPLLQKLISRPQQLCPPCNAPEAESPAPQAQVQATTAVSTVQCSKCECRLLRKLNFRPHQLSPQREAPGAVSCALQRLRQGCKASITTSAAYGPCGGYHRPLYDTSGSISRKSRTVRGTKRTNSYQAGEFRARSLTIFGMLNSAN